MTIWVLHQAFSAYDITHLAGRTHLTLPFGDVPDLSRVHSEAACRHLLRALHPDEPPEAITRRADRIWPYYSALAQEDIIVVPLPENGEAALAEITGPYDYTAGEHRIPVRWHEKRIPFRALRRHKDILESSGTPLKEVTRPDTRIFIREQLPHAYNRFVKFKWLMVVFFALSALRFLQHFSGR